MSQTSQSDLPEPTDDLIHPSHHKHPLWWRIVLILAGGVLILLGMVGWLVPIVTGIPFYIAGFIVLAAASHRVRRAINWFDRKLPARARIALRYARDRMHNWRRR